MLTINQQPITRAEIGEIEPMSVEAHLAALASEIAERLEEMEVAKMQSGGSLLSKLAAVRSISPVAFRLTIQLLHGNTDALESYASRAKVRGISKQTVYLECKYELAKVKHLFPSLVSMLETMQANALAHEDPMSNADAIRQGKGHVI